MYVKILNSMGRREQWSIKVKASALVKCCDGRLKYHRSRVTHWTAQMARAEKDLRESGIKLEEFDPGYSSNSMKPRMGATLDPTMANALQNAESRLKTNQMAVNTFVAFRSFFVLAKDQEFDLNADDVLYFNLGEADTGEGDNEQ